MSLNSQELLDRERLLRYLDNELTPVEILEVESWLKCDLKARAMLAEIAEQAILVADLARPNSDTPKISQFPDAKSKRSRPTLWLGISALLVIFFSVATLQWNLISRERNNAVAHLEFVSEDAVFSNNHKLPRQVGSGLGKGWVQLEQGHLNIRFRSGASVELEGPAAFGIDTSMRSYLDYGRVRVHAPESARDFVVATESMEVVDLGTKFDLTHDRETGESEVFVIEGLVDLHLGTRGAARTIQPLGAGFTAQVDASGEIVTLEQRSQESAVKPNLLAHWNFDGTANDSSENQIDGEFHPAENGATISGISGQAFFLGERGFVDLSEHAKRLGEAETFTLSAWVRDPSDRIAILFSLTDGTENERVQIHLNRRHLVFGWQNGMHFDSVAGRVDGWEPDRWYHVAVAVRGGMVWLYRDGQQIRSATIGQKLGTRIPGLAAVKQPTNAYLGKLSDAADGGRITPQWLGGAVDEVRIYSGAVSQSDIRFLFEHPNQVW